MLIDDVFIAFLLGGIGLSVAYFIAEYSLWRSHQERADRHARSAAMRKNVPHSSKPTRSVAFKFPATFEAPATRRP